MKRCDSVLQRKSGEVFRESNNLKLVSVISISPTKDSFSMLPVLSFKVKLSFSVAIEWTGVSDSVLHITALKISCSSVIVISSFGPFFFLLRNAVLGLKLDSLENYSY